MNSTIGNTVGYSPGIYIVWSTISTTTMENRYSNPVGLPLSHGRFTTCSQLYHTVYIYPVFSPPFNFNLKRWVIIAIKVRRRQRRRRC